MAYTIMYRIYTLFKQGLIAELLNCDYFVIGFEESLNKVSQKQQMDLNVRFWCAKSDEVKCRYLTSAFLGHSRASDLLEAFKEATQPLDLKKLLQISMDGPNVNKKIFQELSCSIKEIPEDPEILNMGSCGLHTVNVAFKAGAVSTGWNIVEFLRAIYYLFKDSPARRALYTYCTKSNVFPQKFCSVRWLENSGVANRALIIIPHLKKFIEGVEKDKITPTSKSFLTVKNALSDKLLSSKLAFFSMVANEVEPFLKEFQSDIPLIPFLYNDLLILMKRLMGHFVKKDVLSGNDILQIDLNDISNLLPIKNMHIGISTQCNLNNANVTDIMLSTFKRDCRTFLQNCCNKLKERSPLIYQLTKAVSCFDPTVALNQELYLKRLTKLLFILCQKNWMTATIADQTKALFIELCSQPQVVAKLKEYKRSERIDNFWLRILSEQQKSCNDAIKLLKMIMILSHGNGNVEHGFSINRDCLFDNMAERTLTARRLVYDTVLSEGGLERFEVSKQLILSARNARSKYTEAARNRLKEEKEKELLLKRKRNAENELKKLEIKKSKILEEAQKKSEEINEEIQTLHLLHKKV